MSANSFFFAAKSNTKNSKPIMRYKIREIESNLIPGAWEAGAIEQGHLVYQIIENATDTVIAMCGTRALADFVMQCLEANPATFL